MSEEARHSFDSAIATGEADAAEVAKLDGVLGDSHGRVLSLVGTFVGAYGSAFPGVQGGAELSVSMDFAQFSRSLRLIVTVGGTPEMHKVLMGVPAPGQAIRSMGPREYGHAILGYYYAEDGRPEGVIVGKAELESNLRTFEAALAEEMRHYLHGMSRSVRIAELPGQ